MSYVIPTKNEVEHYFKTGDHPWPKPSKRHRISHKTKAGILRTKLVLRELIETLDIDRFEFENKLVDKDPAEQNLPHSSQSVLRWLRGKNAIGPQSLEVILKRIRENEDNLAQKVPQELENTIWGIYHSPFFGLLQNKPISKSKIKEFLEPYTNKNAPFSWCFPDDCQLYEKDKYIHLHSKDSSAYLFQRGGLHCFTVLVGLVRQAECEKDTDAHMEHMYWTYCSLPGLVRNTELEEYWEDLLEILIELQARDAVCSEFMRPKRKVIESLIFGPEDDFKKFKHPFDNEWNDLDIEWPVEKATFT